MQRTIVELAGQIEALSQLEEEATVQFEKVPISFPHLLTLYKEKDLQTQLKEDIEQFQREFNEAHYLFLRHVKRDLEILTETAENYNNENTVLFQTQV